MAKVDWTNGSFLTPTFMNSYVGQDATTGHNHQGLDATDSAPLIDLTNSVTGTLPMPGIDHTHGSGGLAQVNSLTDIDYGTGSVDWTSSDVTGGLSGTIFYQTHGKMVFCFNTSDQFAGIIDHTEMTISPQTVWPDAIIAPPSPMRVPCIVFQGGVQNSGTIFTPFDTTSPIGLGYTDEDGKVRESSGWTGSCGLGYTTWCYYKSDA